MTTLDELRAQVRRLLAEGRTVLQISRILHIALADTGAIVDQVLGLPRDQGTTDGGTQWRPTSQGRWDAAAELLAAGEPKHAVAHRLGVQVDTINTWIRRGRVPAPTLTGPQPKRVLKPPTWHRTCGTPYGYTTHGRRGETTCPDCKSARNAHERKLRLGKASA